MSKEQPLKSSTKSARRRLVDYTGVSLAALAVSATAYAFTTFATKSEVEKIDEAIQTMVQLNHKLDLRLTEMNAILIRLERRLGYRHRSPKKK